MNYPKLLGIMAVLVLILTACGTAATPTSAPINTLAPAATEPLGSPTSALTEAPTLAATAAATSAATEAATTAPTTKGSATAAVPVTGGKCDTITVQLASDVEKGTGTGTPAATSAATSAATEAPTAAATTAPSGTATTGTSAPTGTSPAIGQGNYLVDCRGMALYVNMKDKQNSGTSVCDKAKDCSTKWPPLIIKSGTTPKAGTGVNASLLGTITRSDGTLQVTYNGWPLYFSAKDRVPGDKNGMASDETWYLISADGQPIQVSP